MRGELPAGWTWSSLEETCTAVGGGTPSKADPAFWDGGTIPWVSPKDMKARVITGSEDRVTKRALQRLTLIPTGSVLLVVRSGILSRTLPVAVTALPVTVNQDMRAFVPHAGIAPDFLAWQLIGKERDVLATTSKDGTTVASIEAPALASFPLAVAPAAEQTRIVLKLEELLSDLDAGVAELKAAQRKLQQYRQSLLKAAVEGSLTRAWREAHPAPEETGADLLARILRERRARWEAQQLAKFEAQGKAPTKGWQGKYPEAVGPNTAGLPELPVGWTWASVDQLSPDDLANGRSVPSAENGARVLRLTAVKNGRIDLTEFKCGDWTEAEAQPFAVSAGDMLIVRGNGSLSLVGRAGLVGPVSQQVAYPDTLIRLRVVERVVSGAWVALVWNSPIVRAHLERRARTSAGIYKISQPDIASAVIPVPPLDEQAEILRVIDQHEEGGRAVEEALSAAVQQSTAQRQNLLRAAFAGQLVPQDPADEPASALLARIRAERADRAPAKRRPARKETA